MVTGLEVVAIKDETAVVLFGRRARKFGLLLWANYGVVDGQAMSGWISGDGSKKREVSYLFKKAVVMVAMLECEDCEFALFFWVCFV